jgi:hypothetical protein
VQWIPGGGHVAGTAKACDAELRNLVDVFKMADVNSAQRGERAMPKIPQPVNPGRSQPNMQFGPGFTSPIVRVGTGIALPHSRSVPGVHAATAIEASHRPPR